MSVFTVYAEIEINFIKIPDVSKSNIFVIYVQHIQEIHVKEYLILLCILNIICLMQSGKYLFRNYIICCPIFSSISNQMLLSTFVVKWEFEI